MPLNATPWSPVGIFWKFARKDFATFDVETYLVCLSAPKSTISKMFNWRHRHLHSCHLERKLCTMPISALHVLLVQILHFHSDHRASTVIQTVVPVGGRYTDEQLHTETNTHNSAAKLLSFSHGERP